MVENKVPSWAWRGLTVIAWAVIISVFVFGINTISAQLKEIDTTLDDHTKRITTLEEQRKTNSDNIAEMRSDLKDFIKSTNESMVKLLENTAELRGQRRK